MEPINHGHQIIRDYTNQKNDISAWWLLLPLGAAFVIAYALVCWFGPAVLYY